MVDEKKTNLNRIPFISVRCTRGGLRQKPRSCFGLFQVLATSKFTRPSKAFHRCKVRVAFKQYSFFQSLVNFDGISYSTLHINNEGVTLRRELFVKIQTATSKGNGLFESICNTFACFFPRSRRYFQEKENLISSILEIVYRSESKIYLAYGRNDEHAKKPWVGVVVGVGLF